MSDQTKPTGQPQTDQPQDAAKAQTKRRVEEYMARLAANPQFKIVTGTGQSFIIGMPGGIPPKPPGVAA
jgi:hypothetical protein